MNLQFSKIYFFCCWVESPWAFSCLTVFWRSLPSHSDTESVQYDSMTVSSWILPSYSIILSWEWEASKLKADYLIVWQYPCPCPHTLELCHENPSNWGWQTKVEPLHCQCLVSRSRHNNSIFQLKTIPHCTVGEIRVFRCEASLLVGVSVRPYVRTSRQVLNLILFKYRLR